MAGDKKALKLVCEILASRQEKFAWKTARYLSRQLRKVGCEIKPKALDALLEAYAESDDAALRYSAFPARKNLDILWGHKKIVGELGSLPNLTLDEEHEFFGPCTVDENAPWCFLSHNHHDLKTVIGIRDELIARGYGAWIFEAEIASRANISNEVQEGLAKSDIFIVYASRYALHSRWVLKEILTGLSSGKKPHVIVSAEDQDLVDFFLSWLTTGWANVDLNQKTKHLLEGIEEPKEKVATTDVETLLRAMHDMCPESERRLVIYPDKEKAKLIDLPKHPRLLAFAEAFPVVGGTNPHIA